MRQYGRDDVDFATFYSDWMRALARTRTRVELERMAGIADDDARRSAAAHSRAIARTTSMSSQSAARASARNVTAAAGETRAAARGALEIYELFPEHTKEAQP